jgi:hypothetical protein
MFQFAWRGTSGVARIKLLPVGSSQNLKKGDPVSLSSGQVVAGAAGAATFVGVMNQDSENQSAGTMVEVILCDDETIFKVDFLTGGTKTNFSDSDLGVAFDVGATTNYNKINPDDVTGGAWVVQKYDNNTRHVWVKCADSKRDPIVA